MGGMCGPLELSVLSLSDLPERVREWVAARASLERRSQRDILVEVLERRAAEEAVSAAVPGHKKEET
jgi:porphobilinogen deaminase